jgi:hypothetical protein
MLSMHPPIDVYENNKTATWLKSRITRALAEIRLGALAYVMIAP